jgi:hypothetical protein
MGKTALKDTLVECHPCGTPIQKVSHALGLLYSAELVYNMCFIGLPLLQGIHV